MIEWFVCNVVDGLGSRRQVENAYRILETGSSANRPVTAFERSGVLKDVVDQLVRETAEGVVGETVLPV